MKAKRKRSENSQRRYPRPIKRDNYLDGVLLGFLSFIILVSLVMATCAGVAFHFVPY